MSQAGVSGRFLMRGLDRFYWHDGMDMNKDHPYGEFGEECIKYRLPSWFRGETLDIIDPRIIHIMPRTQKVAINRYHAGMECYNHLGVRI